MDVDDVEKALLSAQDSFMTGLVHTFNSALVARPALREDCAVVLKPRESYPDGGEEIGRVSWRLRKEDLRTALSLRNAELKDVIRKFLEVSCVLSEDYTAYGVVACEADQLIDNLFDDLGTLMLKRVEATIPGVSRALKLTPWSQDKINEAIKRHDAWLNGEGEGVDRLDLNNANLSNLDINNADLTNAILAKVDLSGADLTNTVLLMAHLQNVDFSGADLSGADFRQAHLQNVDFSGADLRWANFRGARLENVDFSGAQFRETSLEGVDLSGAHLEKVDLSGAFLDEAASKALRG